MEKTFEEVFRTNYKGDKVSLEECLRELKNIGCTQVQAVKLLINELEVNLREADQIVLNSKAWEQEKKSTINIRNNFEDGLSGDVSN
jgi:hypothetical protein